MTSLFSPIIYPEYEVHFLGVGDADAIIIYYKENANSPSYIALIDAGNVSDYKTIKDFLWSRWRTRTIDLAVCTHPDKDHKGGFFGLLADKDMTIYEFWCKDPYQSITDEDFAKMKLKSSKLDACRKIYNHPDNSNENLIDLVIKKCKKSLDVAPGYTYPNIPLYVIGPSKNLYHEAALGIVQEFAELVDEPNLKRYDEKAEVDEDSAKSIINEVDDCSYTNIGSLVLLFKPTDKFKLLLTGDASCSSLREILDRNPSIKGSILKVPHHGSRRNLNTDLIDDLSPTAAVICADGNEKHPNNSIVYYLSKYGNVYSTHKSPGLYYTSQPHTGCATPLKSKIK